MNSIKDEFSSAFKKYDNALVQLIIINVVVWLLMVTLHIISSASETGFYLYIKSFLGVLPQFKAAIVHPWSFVTYAFMHSVRDIFHILFNMLFLYWFGRIIKEYLGSQKIIGLYVWGAVGGAVLFLLVYNLIPFYINQAGRDSLVGASASVMAIMVAAAVLVPNHTFNLLLIGPVKIIYIVAFYVVLSYLRSVSPTNPGGNIAHLGGAVVGYFYIKQLQKGNDWGRPVLAVMNWVKDIFKPKPKVKVSYKSETKKTSTSTKQESTSSVSQDEIDRILDKISQSGYESLTKAEKQKLFNASNK